MPDAARLCLAFPQGAVLDEDGRLSALLAAHDIASVMLVNHAEAPISRGLVGRIRAGGAAVLIEGAMDATAALEADGFHVTVAEPTGPGIVLPDDLQLYVRTLRANFGDDMNIGVAVDADRHAAMEAAEAGADYIAFDHDATRLDTDGEAVESLISWWTDLFEVPVVAWGIRDAAAAEQAIENGAEFIALTMPPRITAEAVERVAAVAAICRKAS